MPQLQLCLFSSTPDMLELKFIVKVLTGTPGQLAFTATQWGYDGIEFMPDPTAPPDPVSFEVALKNNGAVMPVVNTGRCACQRLTLLQKEESKRRESIEAFKRLLDFAGHFRARVGLGASRGPGIPGASREEMDRIAGDVFLELAEYAAPRGAVIMLEAAEPEITSYINTMEDVMEWVRKINRPSFSAMLDTHQLANAEPDLEHGVRVASGHARHIHLYDPSRWPPGVLPAQDHLDWPRLARALREEAFEGSGSVVLAPEGDPEAAARKSLAYLRNLFAN